jgi:hypothetical protein
MDMKWPDSSPKYRKSLVESLVAITMPMMRAEYDGDAATLRKALKVALNKNTREVDLTPELQHAINFAKKSSKNVGGPRKPGRAPARAARIGPEIGRNPRIDEHDPTQADHPGKRD